MALFVEYLVVNKDLVRYFFWSSPLKVTPVVCASSKKGNIINMVTSAMG